MKVIKVRDFHIKKLTLCLLFLFLFFFLEKGHCSNLLKELKTTARKTAEDKSLISGQWSLAVIDTKIG